MSEKHTKKQSYRIRAKIPLIVRFLALFALVATVLVIVVGFYINSGYDEFRLKSGDTQLSKEVIGIVNGYERRETEDGVLKYYITADKATTFTDEHQELENVFLQLFDEDDEDLSDKISANKAIYIPAGDDSKDFRIYFAGDVDVKTRYDLNIQTEQIAYDKSTEVADSQEFIKFQRENIHGTSYGAIVNLEKKTLDLLKDIEINTFASDNEKAIGSELIERAKLKAGRAYIQQIEEKIKLENGVEIYLTPKAKADNELNQPTDIKADKAIAFFNDKEIRKIDLIGNVDVYQKPTDSKKTWTKTKASRAIATVNGELETLELTDNVEIETTANNSKPTRIRASRADYFAKDEKFILENGVEIITIDNSTQTKITAQKAIYERKLDRFELDRNVEINTNQDSKPTVISASKAVYEQSTGDVFLTGAAKVIQGDDVIKGEVIKAELYDDKTLKYASASGNTYLRQVTNERRTEVTAKELKASFNESQKILSATAIGNSDVSVIPSNSSEYTKFGMFAPKEINLGFRNDGTLNNLQTVGRTTIKLNSPNNSPDSANKRLTADKIRTVFRKSGNELAQAFATGNAELIIEPLRSSSENYKTVVEAPRFECDFYAKNNAKTCSGSGRPEVIRYPTVKSKNKQYLSANNLTARFNKNSQDVERFDAIGKAKFSEADRKGIADKIIYTENDGFVRLRGGEPTVWNSEARAKAGEINWDTKANKSDLNGKVSTTYFSQKQTGGATPFGDVRSPVFVTAAKAQFNHTEESGYYSGNARAWQGKNYVRANKLLIQQKEGQLYGEGQVQTLIYETKRTVGGRKSKMPVYASADKFLYKRKANLIRYENNVDIRQGSDRIVAGVANVFLDRANQVKRTVVERNVVITQPNRRATGSFAQYNAVKETIILRGNPAKVSDSENGSSSGREIVVFLKENRVLGKGKRTKNGTGRIRTVYNIKDGKIK